VAELPGEHDAVLVPGVGRVEVAAVARLPGERERGLGIVRYRLHGEFGKGLRGAPPAARAHRLADAAEAQRDELAAHRGGRLDDVGQLAEQRLLRAIQPERDDLGADAQRGARIEHAGPVRLGRNDPAFERAYELPEREAEAAGHLFEYLDSVDARARGAERGRDDAPAAAIRSAGRRSHARSRWAGGEFRTGSRGATQINIDTAHPDVQSVVRSAPLKDRRPGRRT
jgi:hypothetical protein